MKTRTIRSTEAPSRTPDEGERGSLPFLMLVMFMTAALGAVMLTTIVSQTRTASFDETRVRSLAAAQAGVDHVLTRIRTAVNASDSALGDAGRLPCFTDPSTVYKVDRSGTATYRVQVDYYRKNPALPTSKKMTCTGSSGPYDNDDKTRAPRFALIRSTGLDGSRTGPGASRGRTLETTYSFRTTDAPASAGQLRLYQSDSSTTRMCMDVSNTSGAVVKAGDPVTIQRCSDASPVAEQQLFTYRSDLSIQLVRQSGAADTDPLLCLDTTSTPHAANMAVVLKNCSLQTVSGTSKSTWNQRWSVNDYGHLVDSRQDEQDLGTLCIDAASQTPGTALLLQECGVVTGDPRKTWVPSPTTGAGAAGPANLQIVNFQQFATCLDVTAGDPALKFLILYTCKQNPNPSKVLWNQKFTPSPALTKAPTTVLLRTTRPNGDGTSTTYCLKSPQTEGGYPFLETPCPSSATGAFAWRVSQRYATTAADSPELAYADRYTMEDVDGRCLAPGANSDLYSSSSYYKVVVKGCDGSAAQKWNADPSNLRSTLSNMRELTPTG